MSFSSSFFFFFFPFLSFLLPNTRDRAHWYKRTSLLPFHHPTVYLTGVAPLPPPPHTFLCDPSLILALSSEKVIERKNITLSGRKNRAVKGSSYFK